MSDKVLRSVRSALFPLWEAVTRTDESGTYRTRKIVGDVHGMFEVIVDVDALIRAVGMKAVASKRGSTKLQGGAVKIVLRSRQDVRTEGK